MSSEDTRTLRLRVPEMDCSSCATTVGSAMTDLPGVESVDTRPGSGIAVVTYDPGAVERETLVSAVERAGYAVKGASDDDATDVPRSEARASVWRSARAKKTAVGGVLLAVGLVAEFGLAPIPVATVGPVGPVGLVEFVLADLLFLGAVAAAGQEILRGGVVAARQRNLGIDFLMSAAIVGAITASLVGDETLYVEAATLAVLFSIAELLEGYAMDRARNSLRELVDLAPDEATVVRDGEEVTVPVDEVTVGDRVVVRPGEKIPTDGDVLEGESAVDESPVTGESVPVDKQPGDAVYAGTMNEGGYLELQVTAPPGEDTLSQVIRLVEDAEAKKTDREQFVERFSNYYTPLMVSLAVAVTVGPPLLLGAPWLEWFVTGITLLVLACPCAFVISTPVTVVAGITSAARHGVLVKGGTHLEAMGGVDAIALDKTGTLTKGELSVTDVVPVGDRTETDVLRCARGLEARSEHPIGEAIVAHAEAAAVEVTEPTSFESLTGEGVQATLDGTRHYAGKPGLFDDLGFELDHAHVVDPSGELAGEVREMCDRQGCLNLVEDTIPRLQDEGKTVVLVGTEDSLEGIVAVADELRPGAAETVARLRDLGIEPVMLTGDNERTARAIAEQVGITDYRAGLMPDEKVAAVEELLGEYDSVAMVGDGVNDAPALATATVGIAMGAAGSDAAIETADIALLGDDIGRLPYLATLSKKATGVIRQNVWSSLGLKLLLAVGAVTGYVGVALAVLLGDAGMTVGVTGNAMRLSRVEAEEFGEARE
ncbi:heavy metal translocating P-type ATPase [Haloarcula pellucida]|uniref:P-type Cu(+) transporter n=1 Tax=Haloarcula pellucida TaxID=1427151 RepID=A0A830GMC1_9EURY|nr:cation-translocating P-type ATPase [Halomicroarcula pellucida]MBX0348113.1 cadmium-translocating P-type ATPase [Halomicroarcula pellucida]GGN96999.1 cadmium-transporting ATPase [Halomicroarcula pellucida]